MHAHVAISCIFAAATSRSWAFKTYVRLCVCKACARFLAGSGIGHAVTPQPACRPELSLHVFVGMQVHHLMVTALGFLMFKLTVVGVAMMPVDPSQPELDKKTS